MRPLALLFLALITAAAAAQVVTEDVRFDYYQSPTDNDFYNHFSYGTGLSQVQNNGITGGCLQTPDSIVWGFDNALYCSRYKPNQGDTCFTGICFKYDSTGIHPSSFERAMSIWLIPDADFNHYIVATVSWNKKIELITYSWSNNPYPNLNLFHSHWYHYLLTTVFIGGVSHQVYIKAEVFDLGTSGTSTPALVNSSSGTIHDSTIVSDTAIHISITGTSYGGAVYLDDFHFEGRRGYTDCINTPLGISETKSPEDFNFVRSGDGGLLYIRKNAGADMCFTARLFDVTGRMLETSASTGEAAVLHLALLPKGIFIVKCMSADKIYSFRIFPGL